MLCLEEYQKAEPVRVENLDFVNSQQARWHQLKGEKFLYQNAENDAAHIASSISDSDLTGR